MKTSSIKNNITGMMLFLGIAIQVVITVLPENNSGQLQTCNQQLIAKLEQQISKIKLPFGITRLNSKAQFNKGD